MTTPIIIDADSLAKRCIMATALEDLKTGIQPTGGVYGTLTTLVSILGIPALNPGRIIACFDSATPAWRRELVPEYKAERANRREMFTEEEKGQVFSQMKLVRQMFELLGVVCLKYKEREADDTVAACAQLLSDDTPLVISGDKDLWQTVGYGAEVWDLNQKAIINPDNFMDYATVPLHNFVLYKALVGDSSDSLKGAAGCGKKRAQDLLAEHKLHQDTPDAQLDASVVALTKKRKRLKFEDNIVTDQEYLHDLIRIMDLSNAFGGTKKLRAKLDDPPACTLKPFLQFCGRLKFKTVQGDPARFFNPFQAAHKRA